MKNYEHICKNKSKKERLHAAYMEVDERVETWQCKKKMGDQDGVEEILGDQ